MAVSRELMREVVAKLAAGTSTKVDVDAVVLDWMTRFSEWSDGEMVDAVERYQARDGKRSEMFKQMPQAGDVYVFHQRDLPSKRAGFDSCRCDGSGGWWTWDTVKQERATGGPPGDLMVIACARCNKGGYARDHLDLYGTEWDGKTFTIPAMPQRDAVERETVVPLAEEVYG